MTDAAAKHGTRSKAPPSAPHAPGAAVPTGAAAAAAAAATALPSDYSDPSAYLSKAELRKLAATQRKKERDAIYAWEMAQSAREEAVRAEEDGSEVRARTPHVCRALVRRNARSRVTLAAFAAPSLCYRPP